MPHAEPVEKKQSDFQTGAAALSNISKAKKEIKSNKGNVEIPVLNVLSTTSFATEFAKEVSNESLLAINAEKIKTKAAKTQLAEDALNDAAVYTAKPQPTVALSDNLLTPPPDMQAEKTAEKSEEIANLMAPPETILADDTAVSKIQDTTREVLHRNTANTTDDDKNPGLKVDTSARGIIHSSPPESGSSVLLENASQQASSAGCAGENLQSRNLVSQKVTIARGVVCAQDGAPITSDACTRAAEKNETGVFTETAVQSALPVLKSSSSFSQSQKSKTTFLEPPLVSKVLMQERNVHTNLHAHSRNSGGKDENKNLTLGAAAGEQTDWKPNTFLTVPSNKFFPHRVGIFRRRVPLLQLLQWTKETLKLPLLIMTKAQHKEALLFFKILQCAMGDKKMRGPIIPAIFLGSKSGAKSPTHRSFDDIITTQSRMPTKAKIDHLLSNSNLNLFDGSSGVDLSGNNVPVGQNKSIKKKEKARKNISLSTPACINSDNSLASVNRAEEGSRNSTDSDEVDDPAKRTAPMVSMFEIHWVVLRAVESPQLRDELYMQLCKQLTANPSLSSVQRGWRLMACFTQIFPPSKVLLDNLFAFIENYAKSPDKVVCLLAAFARKHLRRTGQSGARGKPPTTAEVAFMLILPFHKSVFGVSLRAILEMQEGVRVYPRILVFLAQSILQLGGRESEGIFRVACEIDAMVMLRLHIETSNYSCDSVTDPNVPASLLKYWLRELSQPLIPDEMYDEALLMGSLLIGSPKSPAIWQSAVDFIERLPEENRNSTKFILKFIQVMGAPECQEITKMTLNNLAMIFAPSFMRCRSDDPAVILANSKNEQAFLKALLIHTKFDIPVETISWR